MQENLNLGYARGIVRRLRQMRVMCAAAFLLALVCAAGCQNAKYLDTKPLEQAGMDFSSVQTIKAMNPTDAEMAEIAKAKMAGLSDKTCIELFRMARADGQPANFAEAAGGLLQAGMTEDEIIELAKMKQMGMNYGELLAMRLTGLSDEVVMEVARRHAAGKDALSGVSLARLKDTGLSEPALLELVHRGIRDNQVAGIVAMSRKRTSEMEILRSYPAVDVTPPFTGGAASH